MTNHIALVLDASGSMSHHNLINDTKALVML